MDNSIVGFVAVFGAMFAIANPFSALPLFLGYTSPLSSFKMKLLAAVVSVLTVAIGGIIVLYAGNAVLTFFGVSIPGLRVGGGLVILLSGLSMMKMNIHDSGNSGRSLWQVVHDLVRRGHEPVATAAAVFASSPQAKASMQKAAPTLDDSPASTAIKKVVAQDAEQSTSAGSASDSTTAKTSGSTGSILLTLMFPFAIPMILGPGFMSTILIASAKNSDLIVLGALGVNVGITFVVFLLAQPIRAVLGVFGMNVLVRLVGLIIIVLAFEIMTAGLVDLLPGLAAAPAAS